MTTKNSISFLLIVLLKWSISGLLNSSHAFLTRTVIPDHVPTSPRRGCLLRRHLATTTDKSSSWSAIENRLGDPFRQPLPRSIDSVLDPSTPKFSSEHVTLFRERHGWCPYSERVWLALELAGVEYDTVRIDNTGGPRPSYYAGQTPQMKWENGRTQGESMDLVNAIDEKFAGGAFQSDSSAVQDIVRQFSNIFPRARPSSRAAYLFQYNGEPLWKSVFETTLADTDSLLGSNTDGPFFYGSDITVADIAWAPFLERYRYQLPCLHDGLDPADPNVYPHLSSWYKAMDALPVYACRVKGDASSWRKVLTMAGFGNAGIPPQIQSNMDDFVSKEEAAAKECINMECWEEFASTRAYVASTPHLEAATIITRNREALIKDIVKQSGMPAYRNKGLPESLDEADAGLRELALLLMDGNETGSKNAGILAKFLDERMCVPRDMGSMTAATIKNLSVALV